MTGYHHTQENEMGDTTLTGSGFAHELARLRGAKGWTQTQLAEQSGLSMSEITKLEQSRREPGWPAVLALAQALDVGVEEFVPPWRTARKRKRARVENPTGALLKAVVDQPTEMTT